MIYLLSFRDERWSHGGPVSPGRLEFCLPGGTRLASGALERLVAEERVTFLLHGSTTTWAAILAARPCSGWPSCWRLHARAP